MYCFNKNPNRLHIIIIIIIIIITVTIVVVVIPITVMWSVIFSLIVFFKRHPSITIKLDVYSGT